MADTDYLSGGTYVPPSIGGCGRDRQAYIRAILDPEHGCDESDNEGEDEGIHRRVKDYFSPRKEGGEGKEKEGYWEQYSFFRWIVYGLAAVGAWKLGAGYVIKSTIENIRNHHKI
jgi:hypothetical protein